MVEWSRYFRAASRVELIRDYLEFADTGRPEAEAATTDVALMNTERCPVEFQWELLLELIEHAPTDNALSFIAEGPLEDLLGTHDVELIDRVEAEAAVNPRFARALTRVGKYLMLDANWERIQAIQRQVKNPLGPWRKPWE